MPCWHVSTQIAQSGPPRLAERWRVRVPRCVRRPSLEDGAGAQNSVEGALFKGGSNYGESEFFGLSSSAPTVLGITAVLHTWGQKLDFHPHLHCIVTGGALSPDGKQWRSPKQRKFLFPVRALAALFRGKFLAGLRQMLDAGELHLPDLELKIPADRTRWFSLLYSKRSGPLCQTSLWRTAAGLKLPGQLHPPRCAEQPPHCRRRYAASDRHLHLTYRDYRHGSQRKDLTLSALEFIRRFSLHILPPGLVRIRHYGILGNNRRRRDIEAARAIFKRHGGAVEFQPQSLVDPPCGGNVLSVVRKSRTSSGRLYRCHGPSAHDGRRNKAMRFLMNILLTHPIPRLCMRSGKNPLRICSVSRRFLRGLYEAPLSPSEVTGVAQLQLSISWRQFNPAS